MYYFVKLTLEQMHVFLQGNEYAGSDTIEQVFTLAIVGWWSIVQVRMLHREIPDTDRFKCNWKNLL